VNPAHITPYAEISAEQRALANDLVFNKRPDALQRFIEGWDGLPGSRVVVVDDVCTTGDSILKACEKAEEAGYEGCRVCFR